MDTNNASAFGAGPPDFFAGNKLPNSKSLDIFEILDHAHVVPGSISFIHVLHTLAGETVAFKAKLCLPLLNDFTIFDLASEDADGFAGVFHPATGACIFCSQISHANAAVHSTGSDERNFGHHVSFNSGVQLAEVLFKIRWTKNVSPLDGTFFWLKSQPFQAVQMDSGT